MIEGVFVKQRACCPTGGPHAQITAEHMSFAAAKRLLATSEMDFAVGVCPSVPPSCSRELLFTEQFGVIARQDHAELPRRLTLEKYAALRYVEVPLYHSIDATLRKYGIARNFTIKAENILTIPFIVARSNLLATVPKGFARVFSQFCKLRVFDPPFELEPYDIHLVWHRCSNGDAAHAWFGDLVRSIAQDLRRDLGVPAQSSV